MTVCERVRVIVAKQLDRDPAEFSDDTDLQEAGFESLDLIETVFALEEEFNIDLPFNANEGTEQLQTVGDAVRIVEAAIAKRDAK